MGREVTTMALETERDEMLTPAEVAARMRVSADTVMRLVRSGRLPGHKFGKQWRVPSRALDGYLAVTPTRRGAPSTPADLDEEPLSADDLAAVREGIEAIRRGEHITLDEYAQQRP